MADPRPASRSTVPCERIVSIEHPCIINDIEKGLQSLGGEPQIQHIIKHRINSSLTKDERRQAAVVEPLVGVSLRPDDPFAKKIPSVGVETRNILVKAIVPTRTGRKRKRGSTEPFSSSAEPIEAATYLAASHLLERLRDNCGSYQLEAVGIIPETHRFRGLPDLQLRASEHPMMQEIKNNLMAGGYDGLRRFTVDLKPGAYEGDIFPAPPAFLNYDQPFNYEYEQAAGVVYKEDSQGRPISINQSANTRSVMQAVLPDIAQVPQGLLPGVNVGAGRNGSAQNCLRDMLKFLETRPLASKRVIVNALPGYSETAIRSTMPYAGYSFKRGPFRDLLIKFGVDPRHDCEYSKYQTLYFQYDRELIAKSRRENNPRHMADDDPNGHLFDGVNVSTHGMTWQVCDVTNALLSEIFRNGTKRDEIELHQWGWYYPGTLTKARVIMRDMAKRLLKQDPIPDEEYRPILSMPDRIIEETTQQLYPDDNIVSTHVAPLASEIRSQLRSSEAGRRDRGLPPDIAHFTLERERNDEKQFLEDEGEESGDLDDVDVVDGEGGFDVGPMENAS